MIIGLAWKFEKLMEKKKTLNSKLFIRALKPNLNVQLDSIRAKVFS